MERHLRLASRACAWCLILLLAGLLVGCGSWKEPISAALRNGKSVGTEFIPASGFRQASGTDDLLRALDEAPAPGSLSREEAVFLADAGAAARSLQEALEVISVAASVELAVPEEALVLVLASFRQNPSVAFHQHLDQLGAKLIKDATCSIAADALDAAEQARVEAQPLTYEPLSVAPFAVPTAGAALESLNQQLLELGYRLEDVNAVFDTGGFAAAAVNKAGEYVSAVGGMIEAPDWSAQRAYFFYLRLCLLPAAS